MLPAVYRNSSIEWKPSPVVALATSPDNSQVAAAREDGSLEIWLVVPSVGWHCQLNIHGDPRSKVSSLVWCRAGSIDSRRDRLLSSSIDGSISEWDLLQLKQKVVVESVAVSIWQIAVAPTENGRNGGESSDSECSKSEFDSNPNLAVACDDGCVRIYSIPDSGDLIYERKLTTANGRVLSVTWSPDASVYSGSSDGLIRCWDVKSGHEKYRITVGLGAVDGGMVICVWSLLALGCGTLVSADSTGSVRFWESHHGTLIQSHSCHNGDVNALAASPSHNRVFSAGSDGQVILYELSSCTTMKKWVYVGNARAHTHDIRALTIAVPISREDVLSDKKVNRPRCRKRVFESSYHNWAHLGVPMLISAGDDAKLFAYSEQKFASPHDICPVPRRLPIQLVRNTVFDNNSWILVQGSCSLDLYCVSTKSGTRSDMGPRTSKRRATLGLMARIKAESSRKIICSTISNSGMLFAYSDHTNPNLFELKKHRVGRNQWTVNKMQLPEKLPYALSMIFSTDSSRLMVAGHDRRIYVVNVHQAELVHTFIPCLDERKELPPGQHPITKMFTSSNGRWLAAIDCFGGIYVFNLGTQRQHWFISRLNGAAVTAGGFPPQDSNVLVVTTSSNQVYEFDVEAKQLGKCSTQHTCVLPKRFQEFSGEVIGLSFFPKSKTPSVMIYSARAMCLIDFGMSVDQEEDNNTENVQQMSIKKLQSSPINGTLKRKCEDYQTERKHKRNFEFYAFRDPALFMGHLSEDSVLVIDKPWIDVVKTFDTSPVHRHIYGT